MTKQSTQAIVDQLASIGRSLGLDVRAEYSLPIGEEAPYVPRYDLVWLLPMDAFRTEALRRYVPLVDGHLLPLAAFEVEGSTTSSKNQIGNVSNLLHSPFFYNFLVVDNKGARKEHDTYRRAVKIVRTLHEQIGHSSVTVLDASMVRTLGLFQPVTAFAYPSDPPVTKGSGGETKAIEWTNRVADALRETGLSIQFDRQPELMKQRFAQQKETLQQLSFTVEPVTRTRKPIRRVTDYYYIPKIDMTATFDLGGGWPLFLQRVAHALGEDAALDARFAHVLAHPESSIHHPLLAIEIETSVNKHAIGSLWNAHLYGQFGIIVAPSDFRTLFQTTQYAHGLRNVRHFIEEEFE